MLYDTTRSKPNQTSTHDSHSLHYESTLVDKIIVFETNFVSSLAILQHGFLFLTIKFGKIKWRFNYCNCFNFFFIKFMQLVTFYFEL